MEYDPATRVRPRNILAQLRKICALVAIVAATTVTGNAQVPTISGGGPTGLSARFKARPAVAPPPETISFNLTLVAQTGDEPPNRPGESFTTFSDPALNAAGQLVFKGNFDGPLSGNEGVYRFNPVSAELSRVVDDSFDFNPPGQGGATSWSSFGPPVIDDTGRVLFWGTFSFGDNSQGLYVFDSPTGDVVFDDGPLQPVPGQPAANGFTTFPFGAGVIPLLGGSGHGATTAHFLDAGFADRTGLYQGDALGGIVRVADTSQTPPFQDGIARFGVFGPELAVNPDGDVVFHATYTGGVGTHGMYRWDAGTTALLRIADGNMTPPGQAPGARFATIDGSVSVDSAGRAAFRAFITGGNGNQGIYVGDGVTAVQRVADNSGDIAVPDHPGASFITFGSPVSNDAGNVAFAAVYGGGASGTGVFIRKGGVLEEPFDLGDAVPGQPGASFFAVGNISLAASGQIAFTARYSGGSGNEGLYFHDGEQLVRVVDESDTSLGVSFTNLHLLLFSGGSGGRDGKPRALNDADTIAFRATLDAGREGIFLATRR